MVIVSYVKRNFKKQLKDLVKRGFVVKSVTSHCERGRFFGKTRYSAEIIKSDGKDTQDTTE